jgi:RNA polymerase sigma factor (TIGR02999 family)
MGESFPASSLLPEVYEELRKLAEHRMAGQAVSHTLQATALVHEAYMRVAADGTKRWANRAHLFHAIAEAMRRILIDHARAKGGPKRGGGWKRLPLDLLDLALTEEPGQILALDEAVSRLEQLDPTAARVVHLRFYCGLSVDETARAMDVSPRTVMRDWAFARAYLLRALGEPAEDRRSDGTAAAAAK